MCFLMLGSNHNNEFCVCFVKIMSQGREREIRHVLCRNSPSALISSFDHDVTARIYLVVERNAMQCNCTNKLKHSI